MTTTLRWTTARRIALRSQGIGRSRTETVLTGRTADRALQRVVQRLHLLQIDSVQVFARAHLMPVFTRCGPWEVAALDRAARRSTPTAGGAALREMFAHEAAYTTPEVYDLLRFRRADAATRDWGAVRRAAAAHPEILQDVLDHVARNGPVSAPDISAALGGQDRPQDAWGWRRTDLQWVAEYLFRAGRLHAAGRGSRFDRLLVTPPVGHPEATPDLPPPNARERREAIVQLSRLALGALGIATVADIADYFRLPAAPVREALDRLEATGEAEPVRIDRDGTLVPMLRHHAAPTSAAPVPAACLVSPFDPMMFHRPRVATLFDVDYRIGIYTPRDRRRSGYYSLPFLLGDRIVALVDLRADRRGGVLEVSGIYPEPAPVLSRRRPGPPYPRSRRRWRRSWPGPPAGRASTRCSCPLRPPTNRTSSAPCGRHSEVSRSDVLGWPRPDPSDPGENEWRTCSTRSCVPARARSAAGSRRSPTRSTRPVTCSLT
ncbi:YcaQ family DNA glycosylase [Brachybacterium sp. EF45031]|uniref:winged helix-turn-helix domain-containing protein n=1 Tax=Brachybacterium sillae TaxID=2810536 RepID=UPI00217ED0EC|nr:crosslink repair DNA glycosylase YcaQ family protein [Brachybacterium sillae]MCS6711007.1 YcaQ family DNA glycosylase [Brachybacterium sillae]